MKSLIESILSKSGVGLPKNIKKVEYLKGQHHFYGKTDDDEIDVTSKHWTKVMFDEEDAGWKNVVAYFCPESEWILYYSSDSANYANPNIRIFKRSWSAVSSSKPIKLTVRDFANFYNDILLKGATIPEFDDVDTDLK